MDKKIKIHIKNIYLAISLCILGILMSLNRKYSLIDFYGRWIVEHFTAFFFFPILFITFFFLLSDLIIRNNARLVLVKFWIISITFAVNVFLILFWEIDVQRFETAYQMIVDFCATILSFAYLWWYYNIRKI